MDWNIQVLGSFEFVRAVLNAAAMFGSGGAGGYAAVAVIGAIIGLIVAALKAFVSGGKEIELHSIAVSAILFAAMFGTRVEVVVEGVLPGPDGRPQIDRVDNVPVGLAVLGHMISNVGLYFAAEMDTAFSTPTSNNGIPLTQGGFGRTIELLRAPLALADPRNPSKELAVLRGNMQRYFGNCSLIELGKTSSGDQFWTAPDFLDLLQASNQSSVLIQESIDAVPVAMSCAEAWQELGLSYEPSEGTKLREALNSGLGARELEGGEVEDVLQEINTAIGSLATTGGDSLKAERLALAALAVGAFDVGVIEGLRNDPRAMQQLMLQQASRQRAVQWASEESMFLKIIRPMIAFFEALTYALAPMMAFLLGFGQFGVRLAAKYLILPIWVVLWMPLLSICNLYTNRMLGEVLSRLDAAIDGGASLAQIQFLFEEVIRIAGTAGLLTAGVPSLAMMLLFGGAVAASAYAGRLQGGDHVNEKMTAGDAATPGAALKIDDARAVQSMSSMVQTGASPVSYSQSTMGNAMVSSAQTRAQSAQETFGSTVTMAYSNAAGFGLQASEGLKAATSRAFSESRAETEGFMASLGVSRDDMAKAGLSETEQAQFATTIAAGLSGKDIGGALAGTALAEKLGGMKTRAGALGALAGSLLSNMGARGEDRAANIQNMTRELSASTNRSEGQIRDEADRYSKEVSRRVAQEVMEETGSNASLREEIQRSNALSHQYQDAVSTQSQYQEARQRSDSFGASQAIQEDRAAFAVIESMKARATPANPVESQMDNLYTAVSRSVGAEAMSSAERAVRLTSGLQGEQEIMAATMLRAAFTNSAVQGAESQHQEAAAELSRLTFGMSDASRPLHGSDAFEGGNARQPQWAPRADFGISHGDAVANGASVENAAVGQVNGATPSIESKASEATATSPAPLGDYQSPDPNIQARVMSATSASDARNLDAPVRAAMGLGPVTPASSEEPSRLQELQQLRSQRYLTNDEADEYARLVQAHDAGFILDTFTPKGEVESIVGMGEAIVDRASAHIEDAFGVVPGR